MSQSGIPERKGVKPPRTSTPVSPYTSPAGSRISGLGGRRSVPKRQHDKEVKDMPGNDTTPTVPNADEDQTDVLDITGVPHASSVAHRNLEKFPCVQSVNTWKLDCSKCHQY